MEQRDNLGQVDTRSKFFIYYRRGDINFGPLKTDDWKMTVNIIRADEYRVISQTGEELVHFVEPSIYKRSVNNDN